MESSALQLLRLVITVMIFHTGSGVEVRRFGNARLERDPAYGTPLILGGAFEEVWQAVGYAHAEDRLYQTFLRLATANGRMAEFYGAGNNQANVLSDAATRRTMYSQEEMLAMVAELQPRAQLMHTHFASGMLERVQEVNADSQLLPFEFSAIGMDAVPQDLFEMPSMMHYVLFTMRRLCSGFNPTYQLQNADLLATLQDRLGEDGGWLAFNDVATELGSFPLLNTVLDDVAAASRPIRRKPPPRLTKGQMRAGRRAVEEDELIESQLRNLSAASFDGSWALVDGTSTSSSGSTFAQFGPQDPNSFPTTFYEVFIDSEEASLPSTGANLAAQSTKYMVSGAT
jgi:acyl-homoserine lactone acylase PvdQ